MRVYSALGWIWFINDAEAWYWSYEPVAAADEPAAFEYAGQPWTYREDGPNYTIYQDDWIGEGESF